MSSSADDVPRVVVDVDTVVTVETRSGFNLFRLYPIFRVDKVEIGMMIF